MSPLDAAGTLTQSYTADSQPDTTAYTAGPLAGISVANTYDALSRRTAVSVTRHPTPDTLSLTSFSYDAASRLHTVSDGTNIFTYSYVSRRGRCYITVVSDGGYRFAVGLITALSRKKLPSMCVYAIRRPIDRCDDAPVTRGQRN